ncbi:peroxiredoxin family protein [Tunicatimonas pelagia]|uniref:peroxiredoxin family protein n=1 Tax=Tunicatimonas pelagia TaxID=931531 RepID=UPI002666D6D9|nr:redoxin domain-containing protein [Tunicatimonas pelagia]WKN42309.1 redoxin domain-containing protein [Tunicatimonas pelagia]
MKTLYLYLLYSAALLSTYSCTEGQSNGSQTANTTAHQLWIEGKILNPQANEHLVLERIGENDIEVVDTLIVTSDSTFRYSLKENEPGFYRLNLFNRQYVNLILDDENIKIVADGSRPDGEVEVTGSTDTDYLYAVNDIMRNMQEQINGLNADYMKARSESDTEVMQQIEQQYLQIEQKNNEKVKGKIREMGGSIAALYAVNFLDAEKEFPFLDELAAKFQEELPDSPYTQQFVNQVESLRSLAIGMPAPDIQLPNPEGDTVSLSSLQGKYVMIDFWAAWCKPCRMENPNVVRMYNKYKDEGFEIYGVSLDRSKEDWVEAIQKDQLTWEQVSDLQYFDSQAARLYNINAIPATVLVDPDGKIIAKNLRGPALEEKLSEIFGGT